MKMVLGLLALVSALLLSAVPVLADDGFYVIAAGPPRVGTKITSLPYTITVPGYYYLTGNLSYTGGGYGITVNADNVTIDLMGFCLSGPSNNNGYGIFSDDNVNLEVRNGTITGWNSAIVTRGANQRVIGVRASGNSFCINLWGSSSLVKSCTTSPAPSWGIVIGGGTISGCTVMNFTPPSSTDGATDGAICIRAGGGTATGNVVLNCNGIGIKGIGPTTINHNTVFNCTTGISGDGGGSIIGNAVTANSGQTGIVPSTSAGNVLDQNSVTGTGTHYGPNGTGTFNGG